jgi:uncharacterized protein (DUF885 family)
LYDRTIEERARLDPVWATAQGLHHHDEHLTQYDDVSRRARLDLFRRTLADLPSVEKADPTDRAVLDLELRAGIYDMERQDERQVRPDLPLAAVRIVHTMLIKDYAPKAERVRTAARRLAELPALIDESRRRLTRPPNLWTRMALEDLEGLPEFFRSLTEGADDAAFVAAVRDAERHYAAYADFLRRDVLPRSDGAFAVGREVYDRLVRLRHGLDLDADRLIAIGRRELDRTRSEMEELARQISRDETIEEIIERIKRRHPTAADLRGAYQRETDRARRFLVERELVSIPEGERLELIDTPEFMRSTVPYAAYSAPAPLDASRTGHFYVTPAGDEESLRGHNFADIENTVLHEAYPGHHLQLVYAKGVDSKIRRLAEAPTLSEGWGLYCEELGHETGFYSGPEARLMALNWRLHRAARVILDAGLHAGRTSYEEAVAFLVEQVHLQRPQAIASVNAYTQEPTYFMSYLVGMLELKRARDAARARLGARFSPREFHERVLRMGNVPAALLTARLEQDWR